MKSFNPDGVAQKHSAPPPQGLSAFPLQFATSFCNARWIQVFTPLDVRLFNAFFDCLVALNQNLDGLIFAVEPSKESLCRNPIAARRIIRTRYAFRFCVRCLKTQCSVHRQCRRVQ